MVAELRLILLGLGVALVVGLWWWERRRSGASRADSPPRTEMFEPRLAVELGPSSGDGPGEAVKAPTTELDTQELPTMRAPVLDRIVPRGNPPVVTIDDLPDDLVDVELTPPPRRVEPPNLRTPLQGRPAADRRRPVPDPPIVAEPIDTLETLETLETLDEVLISSEPTAEPDAGETPPRHQRIIAVRLLGRDGQRIEGHDLKAALGGEGLEFGRYSIYHRVVDGGRPLYSVASLVEPGSFDPNVMDSLRFPGVSMFAVFPGPLPAPQCFDELLATARRLADRLGATLQDDAGSSLTGQRVLSIREDLVHFEHLVALSRSRPRA
jgi:cell division protein ZipA